MKQILPTIAVSLLLPATSMASLNVQVDEPGIAGLLAMAAMLGLVTFLRKK